MWDSSLAPDTQLYHPRLPIVIAALFIGGVFFAGSRPASAQADNATKADAEQDLQAYLAMWSSDAGVTAASVSRFYAPHVVYYGKAFSREQVLADKRAYIRAWPVRSYREVPGTLEARCNDDRSLCHVSAEMTWRRVNHNDRISTGRARISFDFVPADGARKIARESARLLSGEKG